MKSIYIAIGSNMSNPKAQLLNLPERLRARGVFTKRASSLWKNPAWPKDKGYPDYLNAVLEVSYDGRADELLMILQALERESGRIRTIENAPRPLDLDIIDFYGQINTDANLQLPHPRMSDRAFVLLPLAEIASHWRHPLSGLTALEALAKQPVSDVFEMSFAGYIQAVD